MQHSETVEQLIKTFQLIPHIEGGFFCEDFRSEIILPAEVTKRGKRSILTTCYYLLPQGERSIFHKLTSDELWHFYLGGPVEIYEIDSRGNLTKSLLGPDFRKGQHLKYLVKKGTWFGAIPHKDTEYAFFGATVYPGFEYEDWEKGDRAFLQKLCPKAEKIIELLT
jgi:predicted cupin superfamily sugar epimerase